MACERERSAHALSFRVGLCVGLSRKERRAAAMASIGPAGKEDRAVQIGRETERGVKFSFFLFSFRIPKNLLNGM